MCFVNIIVNKYDKSTETTLSIHLLTLPDSGTALGTLADEWEGESEMNEIILIFFKVFALMLKVIDAMMICGIFFLY